MTAMWTVSVLGLPPGKSSKQSLLDAACWPESSSTKVSEICAFQVDVFRGLKVQVFDFVIRTRYRCEYLN